MIAAASKSRVNLVNQLARRIFCHTGSSSVSSSCSNFFPKYVIIRARSRDCCALAPVDVYASTGTARCCSAAALLSNCTFGPLVSMKRGPPKDAYDAVQILSKPQDLSLFFAASRSDPAAVSYIAFKISFATISSPATPDASLQVIAGSKDDGEFRFGHDDQQLAPVAARLEVSVRALSSADRTRATYSHRRSTSSCSRTPRR